MNTLSESTDLTVSLTIEAGHATHPGKRPRNEDFVGMVTPGEPDLSNKGIIAAVADGVSGNDGGREAAEYAVRGLLADYYATPDTWPVTQALERVIQAINGWVQRHGAARRELAGMASTLTALVLRGRFYYFAHVGDSRLYLLRDGSLRRLTSDHVWDRPEMQHVLTRAVGLDSRLAVDLGMGEARPGDVFLLATDGIWASLSEYDMAAQLCRFAGRSAQAEETVQALVDAAIVAGGSDNASGIALRIDALPSRDLRDAVLLSEQLPALPRLKPGALIDGYEVEAEIHASRSTVLYRVVDSRINATARRKMVLKTLLQEAAADAAERAAFAQEEWLARRVVARFFPQVVTPERRTSLYYLTTYHEGHTLCERIDAGAHLTVPDALAIAQKLARAIGALHRRNILHRDIKPDNIHLGDDGELRILDFGVSQSGFDADDDAPPPRAGTPTFLAPEQFTGSAASRQTDLYAAGVTLYWALTRHYPYGEVEPFQHPRFVTPTAPTRYRPDLPIWLEDVLLKAVARDAKDRFETAEEFLIALERGSAEPLPVRRTMPLASRDPAMPWRLAAAVSISVNLLMAYWIAVT